MAKPTQIHSKAGGAGAGGYVAVILVWLLASNGYTIPIEVAGAITGLCAFAGSWLASP